MMSEIIKPSQIKTVGSTQINRAISTVSSKESYDCANAEITRGITSAPTGLSQCAERFPNIAQIAQQLGVNMSAPFTGPSQLQSLPQIRDTLLGNDSNLTECNKIQAELGDDWLGCLWGSPMADFSCTCPDVGANFANYLKLRLNVATFWNTPKDTPVKRAEFLDAIKYGRKTTITVVGTFLVRPGDVIEIKADSASSYGIQRSSITGRYYVASVKVSCTNTGVQETSIVATQIIS